MALRIIDHIVTANPEQEPFNEFTWRWGPAWSIPPQAGRWIVTRSPYSPVAIRVAFDRKVVLQGRIAFQHELEYWQNGKDREDEQLRGLDMRVSVPERITVPAGATYSAHVPVSIEDTLAELNEKARRELDADKYPASDDCPETGTWVRAARLDADMQLEPEGKWHHVTGWNGRSGGLGVRCWVRGRNGTLNRALYRDSRWLDRTLLRMTEQPTEDACRRCLEGLERDGSVGRLS